MKKKLKAWALSKNLNSRDTEDVIAAQDRLDQAGKQGIVLVRGKLVPVSKAYTHKGRGTKSNAVKSLSGDSTVASTSSSVVVLSFHPRLRPEAALHLLGEVEAVLREQHLLLHRAKAEASCLPDATRYLWKSTTAEARKWELEFVDSVHEGIRAHEEQRSFWATLCWSLAWFQLEGLVHQTDLDVWSTFVNCCIRLDRSGLKDVGESFLRQLRWLSQFLGPLVPHRMLLHAITDVTFDDLVGAGLFFMEAKVHQIEALWPEDRLSHTVYEQLLQEERFYQSHCKSANEMPSESWGTSVTEVDADTDVSQYVNVKASEVSKHMLAFEYEKSEQVLRHSIRELESRINDNSDTKSSRLFLSSLYTMLGCAQFHQEHDAGARDSYSRCITLHYSNLDAYGESALPPTKVYSILRTIIYLDATTALGDSGRTFDCRRCIEAIEYEISARVHAGQLAPLKVAKPQPDRSIKPTRPRPLFMNVHHDKAIRHSKFASGASSSSTSTSARALRPAPPCS